VAPYLWSRSVKTGVWLRALGNGDQRRPMGRKAREGLYVFTFTHFRGDIDDALTQWKFQCVVCVNRA